MDLYQKNTPTLRKLLSKRQNPFTQIFKCQQLSNPTNQPKTKVNLQSKAISRNTLTQTSQSHLNISKNSDFFCKNLLTQNPSDNSTFQSLNSPLIDSQESDDEELIFDKIEKRLKMSNGLYDSRKTSYEYASDHSTTCENQSVGSPILEVVDLQWSPLLSFKTAKDPSVLLLNETEPMPKASNLFLNFGSADDFLTYRKVQSHAEKLGGSCLSKNVCFPGGKLRFRCKLRHQWETTLEELEHKWCLKCESLLKKCRSFASQNGGVCLNETLDDLIYFRCCQGHEWNINFRRYDQKWCSDCAQEEKERLKKLAEEERKRREKINEEYQKKLFEEARRKVTENIKINDAPLKEDVLAYFQKVDREVEILAQKEAKKFMEEQSECQSVSYEQSLRVYKILMMPEDILDKYMTSLSVELLKSEFRKMAKVIHPDKNKHPLSGNAFQKIYKVYEAVVGRFEGSQKI